VIPENGEGSHIRTGVVDGVPRLFNYRRIGAYPLVVTVGLDLEAALAPARRDAFMIASMAALATLLLVALGFYLIRQNRLRAAHEIELAEERRKLRASNVELVKSKERAEAASRAKSTFLANMSHELRTPLNAILGFSEMLIGGNAGILQRKQHEYIENIHQSGAHLLTVITDVLDLAKIEAGRFELRRIERLRPENVARNCVDLQREHAAARMVEIALDMKPPVPPIGADAGRIKQILLNLLDNAIKFSPAGGTVTLTVREADAGIVEFIVADNGPGMAAEELTVALQPFSQVDDRLARSHEGSGLGLPLAERLAEVHGGSLRIESKKGHGTRVIVRLPQAGSLGPGERPVEEVVETTP
jgi:signal transduction histidine kinase